MARERCLVCESKEWINEKPWHRKDVILWAPDKLSFSSESKVKMEDEVATVQSYGPFRLLKEAWQVCDPYPVNQGKWGDCQAWGQADQRQVTVDMGTLFTLLTLLTLLYTAKTLAWMPIYIVREGLERYWKWELSGWRSGWIPLSWLLEQLQCYKSSCYKNW